VPGGGTGLLAGVLRREVGALWMVKKRKVGLPITVVGKKGTRGLVWCGEEKRSSLECGGERKRLSDPSRNLAVTRRGKKKYSPY